MMANHPAPQACPFKQLRHGNLINCALLVIRYYGGTKLGTGGLQRAYNRSAQDVLAQLNEDNCKHIPVSISVLPVILPKRPISDIWPSAMTAY